MATKDETMRTRIDVIKADLRCTSTCTDATVLALQELLLRKEEAPAQKENVRAKAPAAARRRAGAATAAATADVAQQQSSALAPREKYILATETANKTLQTLADALKKPPPTFAARPPSKAKPTPPEDARKPARPRPGHTKTSSVSQKPLRERSVSQLNNSPQKPAPRRSSSYSSFLSSGPEAGLVATAECARTAFAYLGTTEAMKVLGKDAQELQYENGVLVLIGKLVALGLDSLAAKELRVLKRRLDRYLGQDVGKEEAETRPHRVATTEKESLASLLDFPTIDAKSPAVLLVANLQTYTLRVIAKLRRPRLVEAVYEHLNLSNSTSPANLLWHTAKVSNGQAKVARQLESLAQTILSLCPSISSADDANTLQPSAHTVLLLQHLAFKIRKRWWSLVKHQGNEEQELLEPFARCIVAFARRSQLAANKKYKLAETLSKDLMEVSDDSTIAASGTAVSAAVTKTLSSLAQAAGSSDEALRWLGPSSASTPSGASAGKQTVRVIRVATISLEAHLNGDRKPGLEATIINALDTLNGSLGGSVADLETLFAEVNALRRTATRLIVANLSAPKDGSESSFVNQQAVPMIAASVRFSARFIGTALSEDADAKKRARHTERVLCAWKCAKSIVDSVIACCKQTTQTREEWKEVDTLMRECSHIIHRFEEEIGNGTLPSGENNVLVGSYLVKLSNAYWAVYLQLRKARLDQEYLVAAMQRSISLVQLRDPAETESGLLPMKLEQLGEALEDQNSLGDSREAFRRCIQSHLSDDSSQQLSILATKSSLCTIFGSDGSFGVLARVLKAYHHSFIKFGTLVPDEMAFFDNDELHRGTRGALLELQLNFYIRTLSKNRQWDPTLNKSVCTLAERLHNLYAQETYPIRHLRLRIMLLQLSQHHPHVLSHATFDADTTHDEGTPVTDSEDNGLKDYESHLSALLSLRSSMRHASPLVSTFQQCFATWESLVNTTSSWDALPGRIDDTENWLQELQSSLEYLNAKGEEYLALPLLHLLVKILELQKTLDVSELVMTVCALGLQFLRLGYTGKAGLCLAKAEAMIKRQPSSIEARLRWHMAYAEYLLGLGNTTKW
jgi:separase